MFIILLSLTVRTKSKKVCFEYGFGVIDREMATCVLVVVVVVVGVKLKLKRKNDEETINL